MAIQKTTLKRYNGTGWDQIYLATSSDITSVGTDITVLGSPIGAYNVGDVIAAAEDVQAVLTKMLHTRIAASYTTPTEVLTNSLGSNSLYTYEVGAAVNGSLTSVFTAGDAGAINTNAIRYVTGAAGDSLTVTDTSTAAVSGTASSENYTLPTAAPDGKVVYQAFCTYAAGAIKNDNLGDASPNGSIGAGTLASGAKTIIGTRKMFYGADSVSNVAITTTAAARALSNSVFPVVGSNYTSSVATGSKKFTFAFPASLVPSALSVVYVEDNANITNQFIETAVSVEGANGYTAVPYRIFTVSWAQPTVTAMTFKITL